MNRLQSPGSPTAAIYKGGGDWNLAAVLRSAPLLPSMGFEYLDKKILYYFQALYVYVCIIYYIIVYRISVKNVVNTSGEGWMFDDACAESTWQLLQCLCIQ